MICHACDMRYLKKTIELKHCFNLMLEFSTEAAKRAANDLKP